MPEVGSKEIHGQPVRHIYITSPDCLVVNFLVTGAWQKVKHETMREATDSVVRVCEPDSLGTKFHYSFSSVTHFCVVFFNSVLLSPLNLFTELLCGLFNSKSCKVRPQVKCLTTKKWLFLP